VKCNQCGLDFLPWTPREGHQIEEVAASLGTICRPCLERSIEEFGRLRAYAESLRARGVHESMVDRLVRLEFDIQPA
jgi:hypothetical protein